MNLAQLAAQSGLGVRTLRHWMGLGLLPKPNGRGRGAHYDRRHLLVARAVMVMRMTERSTDKIRARLSMMGEREMLELVPALQNPAERLPQPPREPSYPFRSYEVVQLLDGLTLLVDPSRGPLVRRIADDIHRHYALKA
jgi:DNA-binding transcriptional MerR regulator